jgi:hypothetical protein
MNVAKLGCTAAPLFPWNQNSDFKTEVFQKTRRQVASLVTGTMHIWWRGFGYANPKGNQWAYAHNVDSF